MGFYTGSGITVGGSDTITPFATYVFRDGEHQVKQWIKSSTTSKRGVSLESALNEHAENNMSPVSDTDETSSTTGGITYSKTVTFQDAKGTRKSVSYSRIGESNLFELTITNETVQVKIDNGNWS